MKNNTLIIGFIIILGNLFLTSPVFARCAVCVVNGMSGASIAVLIIISVFIFLGLANWGLKKFLDKN